MLPAAAPPAFTVQRVTTGVPYSGAIGTIAIDPRSARNVTVASLSGGAFASSDGGRSWHRVDGLRSDRVEALLYLPASHRLIATAAASYDLRASGLWVRDARAVWRRSAAVFPPGCSAASAWGISAQPDSGRLYVATDCGIAVGSADARQWHARSILGASPPYMSVVALGGRRAIVGGPNGFWYTRDGGATFRREKTGIGGVTGIRGLARDPRGGERAYAVTDAKRLYETRDGGATWHRIEAGAGSLSCGGDAFVKAAAQGGSVALYFGNRCDAKRTTFDARAEPFERAPAWTPLEVDHPDARDLAFEPGAERPVLMSTDGGLHASADATNFHLAASPATGLDALQVTGVAGQYVGASAAPDLYFTTQDDLLWAVRDGVATGSLAWEGFYLALARHVPEQRSSIVTYAVCGGCKNGAAGALLRNPHDWNDASPHQRAPVLAPGGQYVQQAAIGTNAPSMLAWSADRGATWRVLARFTLPLRGEPVLAGDALDPVAFQPVQSGTNADGTQIVRLATVTHLTSGAAAVRYPAMQGFGSLAVVPTAFAWFDVLGVDPEAPAHAIAPDAGDGDVKVTYDGGDRWIAIPALHALLSHGGRYALRLRANDRVATLVSAVAFCPGDSRRVLIATRAGGAYLSSDGGVGWQPVPGSGRIAYGDAIFWLDGCASAWIATYGSGIWRVTMPPLPAAEMPVAPALGPGLASLPPLAGPGIAITSGTIEEGERVLDPHDPLSVAVTHVPALGRFVLAVDGRAIANVAAGLPLLEYSAAPAFWPTGHHAVSVVDVSQSPAVTLSTSEFVVP